MPTKVANIKVPDYMSHPVDVCWAELGQLLGSKDDRNDRPSMVTIISSDGGLGKTTFCLSAASYFIDPTKHQYVLFNTLEEAPFQLVSKIKDSKISFLETMFVTETPETTKFIYEIEEVLKQLPEDASLFIICDSLQLLTHGDKSYAEGLEDLYHWIKRKTSETKQILRLFMISQVTKTGQIKGPNSIKHCVDRHVSLYQDSKTGKKYACVVDKNRKGVVNKPMEFQIIPGGVVLIPSEW